MSPLFDEYARPRSLPTVDDLSQLSQGIRSTAAERGLMSRTTRRYEAWIFLFLSWCLTVPPFRICRTRIGSFWSALQARGVGRWEVCQAMDALGFFFGAVLGRKSFSFPRRGPSRQPRLSATTVETVHPPLPLDSLSDGAPPWTVVPTRTAPDAFPAGPPTVPPPSEERPTFWDLLDQDTDAPTARSGSTSDETTTLTIPRALADQIESLARQQGLSPEALARQVLKSACRDAAASRRPHDANGTPPPNWEAGSAHKTATRE
jgi:hypothetical protein